MNEKGPGAVKLPALSTTRRQSHATREPSTDDDDNREEADIRPNSLT